MINREFLSIATNKAVPIILMVLTVLMMLIIPLPTWLIDIIIITNIALSVTVLMVVVYMDSPINLTAFPSILLILALFRIGITVSTSRLILLQADAGRTVETFGEFVAGGNMIVGIIIFATVTIINFIVITKGAERVAEVSARFSLDAMPGKQMSIDNDLRNGAISNDKANEMRNELDLLSKLYGAMDGAMKFVKGDAIASIIDILINLVGGIVLGVMIHDLDLATSAQRYSILTIGDGLVQQIPAILVSLTAGLMITKVSDSKKKFNMGEDIINQVFFDFRPIMVGAVFILLLTLVPGLPILELGVLGLLFGAVAFVLFFRQHGFRGGGGTDAVRVLREHESLKTGANEVLATPMMFRVSNNIDGKRLNILKTVLFKMKILIKQDTGVSINEVVIRQSSDRENHEASFEVYEIPIVTFDLKFTSSVLCICNPATLLKHDIKDYAENTIFAGHRHYGLWVDKKLKSALDSAGINYMNFEEFCELAVRYLVYRNISSVFGMNEVRTMLTEIDEFRDLSNELLRMLTLNKITTVFEYLIRERISIRHFKTIIFVMLEAAQSERDPVVLTEHIRKALSRYIISKFVKSQPIDCIFLADDLQDTLRDSIFHSGETTSLDISLDLENQIIYQIEQILNANPDVDNVYLVTTMDIRPYVWTLINNTLPFIMVLSFQEIGDEVSTNNLGFVSISLR